MIIWTPFTEKMPPTDSGYLLVTNNLTARDSHGNHSHVWLTSMVHVHTKQVRVGNRIHAEEGEITAFARPGDGLVRNLTHWRFALPEEYIWETLTPPSSHRFLFWQLDNPTSLVCGRLHPRHYLEQVLGLHVLEYRGSLMGGFITARVSSIPKDLTLPEFIREVEGWPTTLREGGDR